MPNLTGGKNYKKTKHHSEKSNFVEKEEGQMFARVLQVLGNRNVLVYCNDNITRLCHIRGSIKKDMWINIGDVVLISIRDFLLEKDGKYEKGDILHRYDRDDYSKIKKTDNFNSKILLTLETASPESLRLIKQTRMVDNTDIFGRSQNAVIENTEDIFEHGSGSDDDIDINAI